MLVVLARAGPAKISLAEISLAEITPARR
jgi:hypothetical protein